MKNGLLLYLGCILLIFWVLSIDSDKGKDTGEMSGLALEDKRQRDMGEGV